MATIKYDKRTIGIHLSVLSSIAEFVENRRFYSQAMSVVFSNTCEAHTLLRLAMLVCLFVFQTWNHEQKLSCRKKNTFFIFTIQCQYNCRFGAFGRRLIEAFHLVFSEIFWLWVSSVVTFCASSLFLLSGIVQFLCIRFYTNCAKRLSQHEYCATETILMCFCRARLQCCRFLDVVQDLMML